MRFSIAKLSFLLLLAGILSFVSGCSTVEPDNASVRPWNAPQGWENSAAGMDLQHR
jgi:hypothetical protein